jgi:hypothetical protein
MSLLKNDNSVSKSINTPINTPVKNKIKSKQINEIPPIPKPANDQLQRGVSETKSPSTSPNQKDINDNNNDNNNNDNENTIVLKVSELVTPFITEYVYDINDIKLPMKLLYEGIVITNNFV